LTAPVSGLPFNDAETTKPPGTASSSTLNDAERRRSAGSFDGTTGRSLTTESSPLPWTRRPRTTTPAASSRRSGVSKKYTWRICASSGSIPSARIADRWSDSGTVSLSSVLSQSWSSSSISGSNSSAMRVLMAATVPRCRSA
jgi:hypothetical protein